jgi:O-antigen/teichoic acid export membrane protein
MLSGIVGTIGTLFNAFLNGLGDANKALLVTSVSTTTGLALNSILIPGYGMIGAAYSSLVAAVLLSAIGALVVKAKHRIRLAIGTITPLILAMCGFGISILAMRVYNSHVL